MAKLQTIEVETASGVTARHLWMVHNHSTRLAVLLPGRGYTCEHPVMYYIRKMIFDLGFDTLSIQYSFHADPGRASPETLGHDALSTEAENALSRIDLRGYEQVCYIGKSMGTPLAVSLAQRSTIPQTRMILLTPVGGATQRAGEIQTLAIIGTADHAYTPEIIQHDHDHRETMRWLTLINLTHSLEIEGDWSHSLAALDKILSTCQEFLQLAL